MDTPQTPRIPNRFKPERGVTFLWVAVGLFLLAILLLFAVQPASIVAQRMKEQELLFRGREYTEAVRLYQYEHGGGFPTHLEDLMKPGPKNHRYIRQLWKNPFDEKGEWGLLAPGSTVVTIDDEGRAHYNSQALPLPGTSPTGYQIQSKPGQGGTGSNPAPVPGSTQRPNVDDGDDKTGPGQGQGQGGAGSNTYVLPFRLDGQDGQAIVGVWCKFHKKAFTEFFGKFYYNEWYFSPLVIPPQPPPGVVAQPGQTPQNPQGPPTGPPTGPPKGR
jgi:hypothetical protein